MNLPSDPVIWFVIIALGAGTYLIRWSFLGVVGNRDLPDWVIRLLRYTPVAVLPALVTPLVVWPAATDSEPDPARLSAAAVTVAVGLLTKNVTLAIIGGAVTLFGMLHFLG